MDFGSQTLYSTEPYVAWVVTTNNINIIDFGENPEYSLKSADFITTARRTSTT